MPISFAEQRNAILSSARTIIDRAKSANRELTADESASLQAKIGEVKAVDERAALSEAGIAAMKSFGDLGDGSSHQLDTSLPNGDRASYLDISPAGLKRLGTRFANVMTSTEFGTGRKVLLPSGDSLIDVPTLPTDPVSQAQLPFSLLSALPVIKISAGAAAKYVRQSVRTNNAAAVATGALKPTSVLSLAAVLVALKTYATLSEPVDKFLIEDSSTLAKWVATDLLLCVTAALEADVISGDPTTTPASIRGLVNTSGIVVQAFSTDLLTSLRAAVTQSEQLGYNDSLIFALSAADWASAEQARASTGGTYDIASSPLDAAPRRIWGIPVTTVTGLPAKTGFLINRSSVALYTDSAGVRTDWASGAAGFEHNTIVARTEGRFDLAVLQPQGVIKVGTAA